MKWSAWDGCDVARVRRPRRTVWEKIEAALMEAFTATAAMAAHGETCEELGLCDRCLRLAKQENAAESKLRAAIESALKGGHDGEARRQG